MAATLQEVGPLFYLGRSNEREQCRESRLNSDDVKAEEAFNYSTWSRQTSLLPTSD